MEVLSHTLFEMGTCLHLCGRMYYTRIVPKEVSLLKILDYLLQSNEDIDIVVPIAWKRYF